MTGVKNPSILVTIQDENAQGGTIATSSLPVNTNGVFYSYSKEDMVGELKHYGYVQFIAKNKVYWVALDGVTNAMGFPTEQFFKTVIDSFAVVE